MVNKSDIITVVVPVFNREALVKATLDSIAYQHLRPRLIIVDNGSTDHTLSVVTEWAMLHSSTDFPITILEEPTKGASAARQKGLDAVTTPYVAFFDSDDVMRPTHIARLASAIKTNPEIDIFGWDILAVELDGRQNTYHFYDRDIAFRHIFNSIFSTQRYAIKTDFLRKAGGWNAEVLGWNDYELGIRLICSGPKVMRLNGMPTVVMRRTKESITGTSFASGAEKWEKSMSICRNTLQMYGQNKWLRWLDVKLMVLAGLYARESDNRNAARLKSAVLDRQTSRQNRLLLKTAYIYTSIGGRGIHHLLRPLM
ncbi:MAG: glycosyltransferase family 2 protein [Muribaculum sp.]|nr:glycosyltransferase family 2 protein [Muribaculum sp.]